MPALLGMWNYVSIIYYDPEEYNYVYKIYSHLYICMQESLVKIMF